MFKQLANFFLRSWHEKKLKISLFFRDIAPFKKTFLKIGHGVCAGPQNFIFEYVGSICIDNNMFRKKVFLGTPPGYISYFLWRCILYPLEAQRGRHGQMPKNRWIFFARPAIIFTYPSGINLRFPKIGSFLYERHRHVNTMHANTIKKKNKKTCDFSISRTGKDI